MKDFAEAYKAWKYQGAKRAGWAEPGKRTQENHAILIPRREAVDMADNLATAIYAKVEAAKRWLGKIVEKL